MPAARAPQARQRNLDPAQLTAGRPPAGIDTPGRAACLAVRKEQPRRSPSRFGPSRRRMHFDGPCATRVPRRGARRGAVRSDASASWELGTRPGCTIAFMFLPGSEVSCASATSESRRSSRPGAARTTAFAPAGPRRRRRTHLRNATNAIVSSLIWRTTPFQMG